MRRRKAEAMGALIKNHPYDNATHTYCRPIGIETPPPPKKK
jgi:hypothetical protein